MHDPILGNPELLQDPVEVRGRALAARRSYLLKHHGEPAYEDLLAKLPPNLRTLLDEPPLDFSWLSMSELNDLDRYIIDEAWAGRISPMRALHGEMARMDMNMAYKVLFKLGTPSFILSKVDIAYRNYFRPGGVDILELKDGRGIGRLRGPTLALYMCSEGIPGWARAAVELSGGAHVAVLHTCCRHRGDPDCLWQISWR